MSNEETRSDHAENETLEFVLSNSSIDIQPYYTNSQLKDMKDLFIMKNAKFVLSKSNQK